MENIFDTSLSFSFSLFLLLDVCFSVGVRIRAEFFRIESPKLEQERKSASRTRIKYRKPAQEKRNLARERSARESESASRRAVFQLATASNRIIANPFDLFVRSVAFAFGSTIFCCRCSVAL